MRIFHSLRLFTIFAMRMLFVVPAIGAVYGGPSKVALEFAPALARKGINVDLVTTNANGLENLQILRPHSWLQREPGLRMRYFPRCGRMEYKLSLSLLAWLWRHIKDYDVVLISSNFSFPVLAAAVACRAKRVPYLITPHGMLEPWALGHKAWKKKIYFCAIERPLVLRGACAIQALNQSEADNIGALQLGSPIITVANGIDSESEGLGNISDAEPFFVRFPTTRGKPLVLFLHRIDPKKGLDVLAKSFAIVKERLPQTHLIVAGPDTIGFTDKAKAFFEAAGCGDAVTFTGMLEGGLKRGAFAASSVFVAPSYSEGFSMSVLEAMAAGLPCVLTTGCNFPEADEARVAYVTDVDAEKFATALMAALNDPPAARALGERARQFVLASYTWDQIATKFQTLVYNLLPEQPKHKAEDCSA